jgi:hypothetical protein
MSRNTVRLSYQKICEMGWVSGADSAASPLGDTPTL